MSTGYSLIMIHPKFETRRQPVLAWVPQPDGSVSALVDMTYGFRYGISGAYLRMVPAKPDWASEEFEGSWGFLADDKPLPTPSQVREHVQGWARVRQQRVEDAA
jgi:hypothetical protein